MLNRRDRARVEALERRARELDRRLENWTAGNIHRTRQEVASLRWALRVIHHADENGVLSTLPRDDE